MPLPFPIGSVRHAVAVFGDNYGVAFDDPDSPHCNQRFASERRDTDVMRRCDYRLHDRGTAFDPRVWIGVPLVERPA